MDWCAEVSLCTSKPMYCRFALSILKEQERKHESVGFCVVRAEMLRAQSFSRLLDSEASSFTVTICPQAPRGHRVRLAGLYNPALPLGPLLCTEKGHLHLEQCLKVSPSPRGPHRSCPWMPRPCTPPCPKLLLWLVFYSCSF
ncbi:unnamed protein product [Rangifer tarandus platyrhynchus]|uniref:Uncharacterized protein n=1 Tax=Rangifer tarandus platyrhynchus TaxID=3082113 RepID=A0AC60A471_RANTA